jgi:hypothetical protein
MFAYYGRDTTRMLIGLLSCFMHQVSSWFSLSLNGIQTEWVQHREVFWIKIASSVWFQLTWERKLVNHANAKQLKEISLNLQLLIAFSSEILSFTSQIIPMSDLLDTRTFSLLSKPFSSLSHSFMKLETLSKQTQTSSTSNLLLKRSPSVMNFFSLKRKLSRSRDSHFTFIRSFVLLIGFAIPPFFD